ncbi:DUF4974 domain-containing protein [Bacteroides ihuae]|uniref:DUF4974 domain-containing protein n=1 Tax=Bacteroides ihuae TaxID=1852362 RepID=UPI001114A0E5
MRHRRPRHARTWCVQVCDNDNKPLIEIIRELERWYDVDIVVTSQSVMNAKVHFIAKR